MRIMIRCGALCPGRRSHLSSMEQKKRMYAGHSLIMGNVGYNLLATYSMSAWKRIWSEGFCSILKALFHCFLVHWMSSFGWRDVLVGWFVVAFLFCRGHSVFCISPVLWQTETSWPITDISTTVRASSTHGLQKNTGRDHISCSFIWVKTMEVGTFHFFCFAKKTCSDGGNSQFLSVYSLEYRLVVVFGCFLLVENCSDSWFSQWDLKHLRR